MTAAKLFEFYAGEGLRFAGDLIPSQQPNIHLFAQRRPLGVVGLITPLNYPLSIPAWKIGSALLCGNTVVWKPSLQHPYSTMVVMQALEPGHRTDAAAQRVP